MIKTVINNVCANTYEKDMVLTFRHCGIAGKYHICTKTPHKFILYNSFDEYVFIEKANFFIKAWQSTQLSKTMQLHIILIKKFAFSIKTYSSKELYKINL